MATKDVSIESFIASYLKITDGNVEEPIFYKEYKKAQMLIAIGEFADAVTKLERSLETIDKADDCWKSMRYYVLGLLASAYDQLGNIDNAEKCYEEAIQLNPYGQYLGEYAIFLHRKKKKYERSEK